MIQKDALAWYCYPEPNGKSYYQGELQNVELVQTLFDYCQLHYASITAAGWKYLIEFHGIPGLLEINRKSGWFESESEAEGLENLIYNCWLSGCDPETDSFGCINDITVEFEPKT